MEDIIKNDLHGAIIMTHTNTAKRIFSQGKDGVDAFCLYCFYAYVAAWQETKQIKATESFVRTGLHWGKDKYHKAKNILIKLNIIEDITRRDANNKILGHYIRIKYSSSLKTKESPSLDSSRVDLPEGGFQTPNAYIYKLNALDKKENILKGVKSKKSNGFSKLGDLL